MKKLSLYLFFALTLALIAGCQKAPQEEKSNYTSDKDFIYFEGIKFDADISTFQDLGGDFGKDKNKAYYRV